MPVSYRNEHTNRQRITHGASSWLEHDTLLPRHHRHPLSVGPDTSWFKAMNADWTLGARAALFKIHTQVNEITASPWR